jgi:hypothetical protein
LGYDHTNPIRHLCEDVPMSLVRPPHRQALTILGVAVLLAGLAWCQSDNKPKKVALLIGVNRYDKRGFAERPLNYAERDVRPCAVARHRPVLF